MAGESVTSPESQESVALRADIERLFSPEFSAVDESGPPGRSLLPSEFLYREITHRYSPKGESGPAYAIAMEGYAIQRGAPQLSIERLRTVQRRFGRERVTFDRVHCAVWDYAWAGGSSAADAGSTQVYSYDADLLQPEIPYDNKFARIVKAYLEQVTQE